MSSNPHYAEALKTEGYYVRKTVGPDAEVIALGQMEATLALAYEQLTANLIAYQANVERSYHQTLTRARSGQANALNRQIIERLGLEDDRV